MNKAFLLFVFLCGCNGPPCPERTPEDVDGIYSRNLGSVTIGQEKCEIFEQYMKSDCSNACNFVDYNKKYVYGEEYKHCHEKILTRITKCASGVITNSITYTPDKFHREQVQ